MKVFQLTKFLVLGIILTSMMFTTQSCGDKNPASGLPSAHDYDYKVFWEWNELFLRIDRYAKGYRPGPSPRALAYMGLSAYECVISAIPENRSIVPSLPRLSVPRADPNLEYYWPAAVNESYSYLMERFFPHMKNDPNGTVSGTFAQIETTRVRLNNGYAQLCSPEVLERSIAFGREVAAAVYIWEQTDLIGHNAFLNPQPTSYTPPTGLGLWVPTPPKFDRALFPNWGDVRTFAISQAERLCEAPITYGEQTTSPYYVQALEVYSTVNTIKNPPPGSEDWSYNQRWSAIFWSDDILGLTFSPPARLIAVLNQVVAEEEIDLAECAEIYAKIGLSLSDASVAIWHSKYVYNTERPITFIHRVMVQQYPEAANWTTILDASAVGGPSGINPPFPAYPSGHSGFAGAGSAILSSFFEYNDKFPGTYAFVDFCHQLRTEFLGIPRSFSSFSQMAEEKAYARIPLGVHLRMDCEVGLKQGRLCAQRVLEMPWKR